MAGLRSRTAIIALIFPDAPLKARIPGGPRAGSTVSEGDSGLRFFQYRTGNLTEGQLTVPLRKGIEDAEGFIPRRLWSRIYGALTEAMKNTINHGYGEERDSSNYPAPPILKQWWMAGSFDADTGKVALQIFDQGLSIPHTLRRLSIRTQVLEALARLGLPLETARDSDMIRTAATFGETATGRLERGKGLPEMRRLAGRLESGRLRIVSRRGDYVFERGGLEHLRERRTPLGGTLIEWHFTVPRPGEEERGGADH